MLHFVKEQDKQDNKEIQDKNNVASFLVFRGQQKELGRFLCKLFFLFKFARYARSKTHPPKKENCNLNRYFTTLRPNRLDSRQPNTFPKKSLTAKHILQN